MRVSVREEGVSVRLAVSQKNTNPTLRMWGKTDGGVVVTVVVVRTARTAASVQ